MQKIYLLLRNNNQLGPFTIEELLDHELMPSDLVWIEGKSLAWSYVSELNLLKLSRHSGEEAHQRPQAPSSVHSVPTHRRKHHRFHKGEVKPAPPPPPESRPKPAPPLTPSPMSSAFSEGDVERKAEELRQRALEAERVFHYRQPVPAPTPYTPDLTGNMESDIEVVYHKRRLVNIPFPQVLVGGMVIAMLVAGWYGQPLFRPRIDTVDATATPLKAKANTQAAPIKPAPAQTAVVTDTAALADSTQPAPGSASTALYTSAGGAQSSYSEPPKPEPSVLALVPETTAVEKPVVVQKKSEPEPEVTKEPEKPAPIEATAKKAPAETEPQTAVAEEGKERKKGFLKGIFRKKKNRDAQQDDDAQGDSAQDGN